MLFSFEGAGVEEKEEEKVYFLKHFPVVMKQIRLADLSQFFSV